MLLLIFILSGIVAALIYFAFDTRQLTGMVIDAVLHSPISDARLVIANQIVTTNTRGEYVVKIPRGIHSLRVEADGYLPLDTQVNGDDLFMRAFALDLALEQNRVTLIVRDAETRQPLPNVQVTIGTQTVSSDNTGRIEARHVKKNTPITAQAPGYQPLVLSFDGQTDIELALLPSTLTVTVLDQYTQQPIRDAQVQADALKATSDANGIATLRRIKPGANVRVTASGYDSAGAPFLGNDLRIALRPNTLEGIVTDATTGQPISGTLVYLGNTIVTTNARGAYRLENVPPQAKLMFKAAGYQKIQVAVGNTTRRDVALTPFIVKGVRVPFAASMEQVRDLFALVAQTELNALVVDVKSERGRIAWASSVPLAKQIGAYSTLGVDLDVIIEQCRTQQVYCIARLPVFQDTLLATQRPAQAVRYPNGTVFFENGGTAWLNPFVQENWNYVIALAKEIAAMGFDEIQFDYVRFPGMAGNFAWGAEYNAETRVATIAGFLARAQKELRPTGVFISADVFGLTTATDDDQHTGQRLRDLGPYVDYLCPMVYPDTWVNAATLLTRGLQIKNCTEAIQCPYEVVAHSYQRAIEKTSTKVRLWIQAYPGRGNFGVPQYRLQKKAAMDVGSWGWMFWSASGTYDPKIFDAK
ncbi:MAG: carboxypeptidase regulatory-like domain-containing protein [Anaerolineae bacterium]|nr:carboxypeptidase regulatory-like domain-containing protein [Anaerolineae bacterium]